jgi:segregation and condensation protein A
MVAGSDPQDTPRANQPAQEDTASEPQPAQARLPHVDTSPSSPHEVAPEACSEVDDADVYRVKLEVFEGPLDLLLHLIRKHELDILDIPVSFITTKYLEYLDVMHELSIDVASEYLVMAATLIHIKSRMLLPPDPSQQDDDEGALEEEDPRGDLVRRLLEYQKYKHAAAQLGGRSQLGRDLFQRGTNEPTAEGPVPLAPVSLFKLFAALERVLKRARQTAAHEVIFERVGLTERIVELTEMLTDRRRMRFDELFAKGEDADATRSEVVITFLALLEMCKMRVARLVQDDPLGDIFVELAPKRLSIDESDRAERTPEPDAS